MQRQKLYLSIFRSISFEIWLHSKSLITREIGSTSVQKAKSVTDSGTNNKNVCLASDSRTDLLVCQKLGFELNLLQRKIHAVLEGRL